MSIAKKLLLLPLLVVSTVVWAEDHQLPYQPVAADGGYIVQWDCTNNQFAAANTMEYDETFIIAVDLHGTAIGEWIMAGPSSPNYTRGAVLNLMRDDQGQEYADNGARLWHIRDTIFGATVNFRQMRMKSGSNSNPGNNQRTQIHARIFGHETALGSCANQITTPSSKGWWQWSDAGGAQGWPSQNSWTHGYIHRTSDNYFFRFAAYTGTHTSATTFTTTGSDHVNDQYWDKDHRVNADGFASPFGSASPCPKTYPNDFAVTGANLTICPALGEFATIQLGGSQSGISYALYCDGVLVPNSIKAGNGNAQQWFVYTPGSYEVRYYGEGLRNTKLDYCAAPIVVAKSNNCCSLSGVTITVSNDGMSTAIGQCDTITVRATFQNADDSEKSFRWEVHGANGAKWQPSSVIELADGKVASEFKLTYEQFKATAGKVEMGGGKNNGYYTIWIYVDDPSCSQTTKSAQKQIHISDVPCDRCPDFSWAIDGQDGIGKSMYAGGWYDISCSTPAGAPTLTITGTGVTVVNTTNNGNTTTCRIELSGNATGAITMKANSPANASEGYLACEDTREPVIAPCEGMTAETWKIEWSNFDGFPEFTYLNFAQVFLRDNNGHLEADTAHTDGMDEWNIIYAGEKFNNADSVFYIQNALTKRYLYRGSQHGNVGSDWEYAEALLSANNAQNDDYKWIFVKFQEGGKTRTAIVCKNGYTGTTANLYNGAYVIHNRNWEAVSLFGNTPQIARPGLPCGRMANQQSSPAFRLKGMSHPTTSAFGAQTTLSWNGTAPTDTVHLQPQGACTYTAQRTDAIHSINRTIHYEVVDATVASIDAQTGAVTALVEDGMTEVLAILERVGCFEGDTLRYVVTIYECGETPTISSPLTVCDKNKNIQLTIAHPAGANEVGTWVFTQNDGQNASIATGNVFKANNYGTYTFYYKITNAAHPDCNRQSDPITIVAKQKEDYPLPRQPKAADGTYVVLWDCEANDFAAANTMEWGETFVLAVNLAGTPLGNWVMKQPSTAGGVRTIAFDRLLLKNGDDSSEHFDLDVSRLWLIRDTIFGATFNFSQIKLRNGQSYTPASGATTGIAARLFGVEAAHGVKCGTAPNVSKWWQWSNNSTYSEWAGEWQEGKYVSEDDQYLFHFAPYTGQSDPIYNAQVDDPRDRWYDNGHDFSNNGYASPCPKAWPADQTLSIDKQTICVENSETATLTLGGSETGWNYTLYNNNVQVSSQAGNGNALTWTISAAGSYTVQAVSANGQHDDQMGSCVNNGVIAVSNGGCQTPVCPDPVYIPYPNLTYNLNADAFPIELAEATGTNVRYQWYYYTDANPTAKPYTGEGATTNACIPATNTEGKTYYYCMVYTDACPDGVVYCNTADVTVQGCQTFNGTSFTLTSNKTNYNEDEQIVLTATFNGYGGEHHYVWKLNGTPIDSSATHQIVVDFQTSTLTIPSAVAADGGTYTVTIYDGDCDKSATRSITVKEKDPVEPTERVKYATLCVDSTIVLRADSLGHYYEWNTGATTDQISVTPTAPGTETYTVRVYDYKIKATNNLMANGDFEAYSNYNQRPTGFSSDYEYLPFDPTASGLYDTYKNKNGVYLLSCDANHTWKGYAAVKPHGGKYFAMFDAAQSGFAWRTTTNDNPNMKLVKGAKYIFSYWAADLNTPIERDHPAELQFSINYKDANGQMRKEDLGPKLILGVDNKWHYNEFFWTAPCNSDYIEIGVEDRCNYAGPGNDFGLDDIIFQMVTGESVVTLDKQKWILTVEDCTPPEPETCEEVIYRKWSDFLFVDNFTGQYVGYQWYSDGVVIPGANGQYYYSDGVMLKGDGHTYHCVMTKADGTKETACAHLFDEFGASVQAGRTPAPVRAMVYSPAGHLLYHAASLEDILPRIPSGCYILRTESDGEVHSQKLIVP